MAIESFMDSVTIEADLRLAATHVVTQACPDAPYILKVLGLGPVTD
jgi:hypothetical protein